LQGASAGLDHGASFTLTLPLGVAGSRHGH